MEAQRLRTDSAVASKSRKLLEGEKVEVRQKEVGLRGSWHSGVIVQAKHCRRVVEYDELLTLDRSKKLRETIPFSGDYKGDLQERNEEAKLPVLRERNKQEQNDNSKKRGFIRPLPPPHHLQASEHWRKGLLVDAFYDDAWWEGVLLQDTLLIDENSKIQILFPEEGDDLQILQKNVRISQEWDENSGLWTVRGFWSFGLENGEIDFSPLRQMCQQRSSLLKALWRQRNFNDVQEQWKVVHNCSSAPSMLQHRSRTKGERDELHDCKASVQDLTSLAQPSSNVRTALIPAESPLPLNADSTRAADEGQLVSVLSTSIAKVEKPTSRKLSLATDRIAHRTRKFRRTFESTQQSNATKLPADGIWPTQLGLEDRKHAMSIGGLSSAIEGGGTENNHVSIPDQGRHIITDEIPCNLQVQNSASKDALEVQESTQRVSETFLLKHSAPFKKLIKQARLSAKKFLLNAGWQVESRSRVRAKENSQLSKQEAVYVSPAGRRYFSLAAACRGWKKLRSQGSQLDKDMDEKLKLLNSYNLDKSFRRLYRAYAKQVKAEQMIPPEPGIAVSTKNSTAVSKENRKGSEGISEQNDDSLAALQQTGFASFESVGPKKCKLSAGRAQKRKGDDQHSSSPLVEARRKRGRPLGSRSKSRSGQGGCRMQVLLSSPGGEERDLSRAQDSLESSHFKRSTVLSWLIDKSILIENEPVCYVNKKDGHVMKKGHVTREGVVCNCCKEAFTLSNFEAHAGSKLHRPSANIFLDDGRSISDCQLQACAIQDAKEKKETLLDVSDDTCGVCGDGGELILCDHCPSTFHPGCIGLEVIPEGDWYCPRCSCGVCSNSQSPGDGDGTMLQCSQCELGYHEACVPGQVIPNYELSLTKTWFCGNLCTEIYRGLRGLLGVALSIGSGFSWMLLKSTKRYHGITPASLEVMAEHNVKLSVAHNVMQECFVPMIDPRTKIDMISHALYSRSSKVTRLNYAGFYTILLEKGDEIVSVATVRVHGARLAEMPLVGTRYQYRRQGMCRRLMHALEKVLGSLGIERLILPAVPELLDTWTGAFNFKQLSPPETRELSKLRLMTFPGTTLLQKHLQREAHGFELAWSNGSITPSFEPMSDVEAAKHASLEGGTAENAQTILSEGAFYNNFCELAKHDALCLNVRAFDGESLQSFATENRKTFTPFLTKAVHMNWRFRTQSCSNGFTVRKAKKEDDVYTKVVITTTRSKRLVRSSRWVADGLKELLKDTSQSKRAPAIDGNLQKALSDVVDEGLECGHMFEKCGRSGGSGFGIVQPIKNVYVRTRKKATPSSAHLGEEKDGQGSKNPLSESGPACKAEFLNLRIQCADTTIVGESTSSGYVGDAGSVYDEGNSSVGFCHNFDTIGSSSLGAVELKKVDNMSISDSTHTESIISTKFYRRRKKCVPLGEVHASSVQQCKHSAVEHIIEAPDAPTWDYLLRSAARTEEGCQITDLDLSSSLVPSLMLGN